VDDADVSFLGGSVGLDQIRVANPPGYQGPSLLTLKEVDVTADTGTLLSNQVVIKDMKLDGMEVFVEQKGLQNNLYEVIKPLRQPHEPSGKTLVIDNLTISEVLVHVTLPTLPGQAPSQPVELKVAPITLTDLGRNERMDTAILIGKVLLAVAQGIAEQGGDILPKETIGEITDVLDKAINIGQTIFGGSKTGDQKSQKTGPNDPGQKALEGLKDILGGNKKK